MINNYDNYFEKKIKMISNSRLPLPNKKKEHVYFETKNTSFRNKHVPFLIKINISSLRLMDSWPWRSQATWEKKMDSRIEKRTEEVGDLSMVRKMGEERD